MDNMRFIMIVIFASWSMNFPGGARLPLAEARPEPSVKLFFPSLVERVYRIRNRQLLWLGKGNASRELRTILLDKIDSARFLGLTSRGYHKNILPDYRKSPLSDLDSADTYDLDRVFTDAALAYCLDLFQGGDTRSLTLYDGISSQYAQRDRELVTERLAAMNSAEDMIQLTRDLEPGGVKYQVLKNRLMFHSDSLSLSRKKQIATALSIYRWTHHFHFQQWIEVNIAEATLRYYEFDSLCLQMKVVVGKPKTRTPRFAASCNEIILYPYWNVPKSIAIKELLPKIKRNPHVIDDLNMQLLDNAGRRINHLKVDWRLYSPSYFPFVLRQSTGCDNSLGVIKFNLTSPFSVYLHDTNFKAAFRSERRFLSHGCIRLEKPLDLGEKILPGQLDSTFLISCIKGQVPVPLKVGKAVPVFVVYQTAVVKDNQDIAFLKDIYGLLK